MPGVSTITGTRPGNSTRNSVDAATLFLAGITERGDDTQAVRVRSMPELVALFGPRVSYGFVHDAAEAFFEEGEGAGICYIARATGGAKTTGTLVLVDRSGGAGVATLNLFAKSPGAYSANITVAIVDGPSANTFAVQVFYLGVLVEQFLNLVDPATAAARITAGSAYLRATDAGSVTAAPANIAKVIAATALSAGSDDRGTLTAALVAALANTRFGADLGPGVVATPGYDILTTGPICGAVQRDRDRLFLGAPPIASTAAGVRTSAAAVRSIAGSEAIGVFYPWVQVPDGNGGLRTIPPEGFVAGVRARTLALDGPWQAPAGDYGRARWIIGVETAIDQPTGDGLNDDQINCIRVINGAVKLYGWRSANAGDPANYKFLVARDVMNYIAGAGQIALEFLTFAKIDGNGHTFDKAATTMRGICQPIADVDGLYARHVNNDPALPLVDPGFRIDAGPSVNTPATIEAGQIRVSVGVRPSPTGELVILTITRVTLSQAA